MKKTWKQKILWHCPSKHQCTKEYNDVTSQNFIKILSIEIIPLKSRVRGFLKINIQEFIFQYRVFTKSIISHPFLNHFHRNNSIYKISTPSFRGKEEICRRMPDNFFSSAQFQRKRKSLVFFQSINFLCLSFSIILFFFRCRWIPLRYRRVVTPTSMEAESIERFIEGQASSPSYDLAPDPPPPQDARPATQGTTEINNRQLANGRGEWRAA